MVRKISIADPNVLAEIDGDLFRFIYKAETASGRWRGLADFVDSPAFCSLVQAGMVAKHTPVDVAEKMPWEGGDRRERAYRVDRIQHFSYRRDWTKTQAVDVVLAAIDINLLLKAEGSPFSCTECFDWNFTFEHTRPVMVDVGAFSQDPGNIALLPVVLGRTVSRTGINVAFNFDRPVTVSYLEELKNALQRVNVTEESNAWDGYDKVPPPDTANKIAPTTEEEAFLQEYVVSLGPGCVLDVGGNAGVFSRLFASKGTRVVAIDNAPNCVNKNYQMARSMGLPITSLLVDCRTTERKVYPDTGTPNKIDRLEADGDWVDRLRCDTVFASSVTHHLCAAGFGFEQQAKLWIDLCPKNLLVEFIGNTGHMPAEVLAPLYGAYSVVAQKQFPPHTERVWYLLTKGDHR